MDGTDMMEYDAWLASAGMPSSLIRKLTEVFGDPFSVYQAFRRNKPEIREIISPRFILLLKQHDDEDKLKKLKKLLIENNIHILRFTDPEYPDLLLQISDPPAILFFQGEINCLQGRIIAMVGSRAASYKGQKAAMKLAEDLSRNGIRIVSGLACGIDTSAHKGCINGGSPTIAVSACGLDRVYPADNLSLRDEILKHNGLILSEYVPGEKPLGWHFPVRNRIISGLGQALILIESQIKSGSITTVHHAIEQGKDLFVYPGDPESEKFSGNHQLLREGAIFFTCAQDILEDMNWLDNPIMVGQNIDCSAEIKANSPAERLVLNALGNGSLSFEQLLDITNMTPSVLMSTITILQISGIVEALPGKQYQKKH